jgi:hypothetical protein
MIETKGFTRKQIIVLSKLARAAYDVQAHFDTLDLPPDLDGESLSKKVEFFRHRETAFATGESSFKDCHRANDYLKVRSHFEKLAGKSRKAEVTRQKQEWGAESTHTDGCAAVRQIRQAQREAGFTDAYVASIAMSKFKQSDFRQLGKQQLWQLCFTIRTRAVAKRRKALAEKWKEDAQP